MRDFTSSPFFISFLFGFSICIFTFWNIQISFCWHIQTVRLIDREIVIDKNKFLGDSIPILYFKYSLAILQRKILTRNSPHRILSYILMSNAQYSMSNQPFNLFIFTASALSKAIITGIPLST